ncbi:MAG TPA: glycoside hydrolase family 31 protein, partial [Clostridiales bacterium]|nr:glycoside hydrolase family 31 protein [Clostridiales bacterium]
EDTFALPTESMTPEKQTFCKGNLRISILTSQLLRVEYQPGAVFCNLPTQAVWNRKLDSVPFTVTEELHTVTVSTEACRFSLSKRNGTLKKVVLFPDTEKEQTVTDFQSGNLKGTTRTLDMSFGPVPLEDGILSRNGVALLDDSHTLVLREDGFPLSAEAALGRKKGGKDYYIFAYGHEYQSALKDFFRLTGMPPLLPKYVFGNWWSRYHAYTQEEYLHLLNRMEEEGIPLSVATIDMDWHWTDVAKRFGKVGSASGFPKGLPRSVTDFMAGWTGYSWNTELFPDYRAFLRELKKRGLAVTVNTHPAKGCRFFEDAYPAFADFMGIRKESKKPIPLNFSDKKMLEGYFRFLHHGYEKDGVDFWWIDWQQGNRSQVPGLDPLWALNHYHFLDRERNGNRPLILSRYAGPGSHRYPLGFSGDTRMSWKVLQFQPYFTATAYNIGYTWWSHDIGGHMGGIHDDELYLRWLQFGVFAPINRMHSSNNLLTGKEPWNYGPETEKLAVQALQFRQRLVPYLYTMNYRCHTAGEPLIRPMYYAHPEEEEAYQVPNEYYFGSELICAPITCPTDDKTKVAGTDVWLPEGTWTDLFTNDTYRGGKKVKMFRGLSSVPVLAKAGAILPLEAKTCP